MYSYDADEDYERWVAEEFRVCGECDHYIDADGYGHMRGCDKGN